MKTYFSNYETCPLNKLGKERSFSQDRYLMFCFVIYQPLVIIFSGKLINSIVNLTEKAVNVEAILKDSGTKTILFV